MQDAFLWITASCLAAALGPGQNSWLSRLPSQRDLYYYEILLSLPTKGERASSARAELDHFHSPIGFHFASRKMVKSKDGENMEILLLEAPSMSHPGNDFYMAFVLKDHRVIDWTSRWSHTRTAMQKLMLDDVDGDGHVDL